MQPKSTLHLGVSDWRKQFQVHNQSMGGAEDLLHSFDGAGKLTCLFHINCT